MYLDQVFGVYYELIYLKGILPNIPLLCTYYNCRPLSADATCACLLPNVAKDDVPHHIRYIINSTTFHHSVSQCCVPTCCSEICIGTVHDNSSLIFVTLNRHVWADINTEFFEALNVPGLQSSTYHNLTCALQKVKSDLKENIF